MSTKHFKTDHDALTALIVSFDDFKAQDAKDKMLIRDDIKQLNDGLIIRLAGCEQAITQINSDKADLRKVAIEIDQRLTRIETTIYGPNRDGKGGGAEQIIKLGDALTDSGKEFESTRKWVYLLISSGLLVIFSIMGYFIYQLNIIQQEHKDTGVEIIKLNNELKK